jgi:RNA polymerase sigma-70 factor (ECF subfamily)
VSQGWGGTIDARQAAELAARTSYGRLVAFLAARFRDVAAAEDALSDALLAALETWPRVGVPHNPEAWLLAAARHHLIDAARHARVQDTGAATLRTVVERAHEEASGETVFPDDRPTFWRPSIKLSVIIPVNSLIERIASSFPGIGY